MKKIDVLWLVEHIAREMDVACVVKALAKERYGINIAVRHIYLHARSAMRWLLPRVVVHPFFYFTDGALATEDYVQIWPQATHFNLAWEEIHYKAHLATKAPADDFAKQRVIHHAWGDFYKDYLVKHGVPQSNIHVNGNPAYQLYLSPYNNYYNDRSWLAAKYQLDESARWIFIPENYRWAFISEEKADSLIKWGGDREEISALREFSKTSLNQLLKWCSEMGKYSQLEIIFRPRPATNSLLMMKIFADSFGVAPSNLHFIKGESVREWILASDVVISSYSTSLIEAAVAGKPIYMAEPIAIPDSLYCKWYEHVLHLTDFGGFKDACFEEDNIQSPHPLRSWAWTHMLANGDPIEGLVEIVRDLLGEYTRGSSQIEGNKLGRPAISNWLRLLPRKKNYFNRYTHENDSFSERDVRKRVSKWRRVILDQDLVAKE